MYGYFFVVKRPGSASVLRLWVCELGGQQQPQISNKEKKRKIMNGGGGVENREPSYTAGESVKSFS